MQCICTYSPTNKSFTYHDIFSFTLCQCSFAIGSCSCTVHMSNICTAYLVHAVAWIKCGYRCVFCMGKSVVPPTFHRWPRSTFADPHRCCFDIRRFMRAMVRTYQITMGRAYYKCTLGFSSTSNVTDTLKPSTYELPYPRCCNPVPLSTRCCDLNQRTFFSWGQVMMTDTNRRLDFSAASIYSLGPSSLSDWKSA